MPFAASSFALSLALVSLAAAPAHASNFTAFDLTTSSNGNTLSVHQEILGSEIVGPDHAIRVLNIVSLTCNQQTFRLTYVASKTNVDALSIAGSALAAALGLLQGMDPAVVGGIVGPDLEVHSSELPYAMEADEAQTLAGTLFAALNQFTSMSNTHVDTRLSSFIAGAGKVGAPIPICGVTSGP